MSRPLIFSQMNKTPIFPSFDLVDSDREVLISAIVRLKDTKGKYRRSLVISRFHKPPNSNIKSNLALIAALHHFLHTVYLAQIAPPIKNPDRIKFMDGTPIFPLDKNQESEWERLRFVY